MQMQGMTEQQIVELFAKQMNPSSTATYEGNLTLLGVSSLDEPSTINIYAKDFAAKEEIADHITAYNESVEEKNQITIEEVAKFLIKTFTCCNKIFCCKITYKL